MDPDADAGERQHAASDHHRRRLVHEMIAKLIHELLRLASLIDNNVFAVNVQKRAQHITHFLAPNPFVRIHKGGRLVSDFHQHLLNLFLNLSARSHLRNRRNPHIHVVIQREE